MSRARKLILVGSVLAAFAVAGGALASGVFTPVRDATEPYQDVEAAKAAGYSIRLTDLDGISCIESPEGGMGVHMVNGSLLLDGGTIEETKPEAMVYAESPNTGRLKLVAAEYVVFKADWTGASPPALYGQEFDLVDTPNRFGLPAFYALHAWIWRGNPSGALSTWNPKIDCAD
jgi:hypothetical protein